MHNNLHKKLLNQQSVSRQQSIASLTYDQQRSLDYKMSRISLNNSLLEGNISFEKTGVISQQTSRLFDQTVSYR